MSEPLSPPYSPPYTGVFRVSYAGEGPAFVIAFCNEGYAIPNPGDDFMLGEAGTIKVLSVHQYHDPGVPFYDITLRLDEETS